MAQKMLIDATHPEETRVVVVDGNKIEEFDFESINKRQLAGNIYLAKVTRVEPSLQAAFVDYGGNRHGFLAFAEIHPDYYQIPVADRERLLAEQAAEAEAEDSDGEAREEASSRKTAKRRRRSGKSRSKGSTADAPAETGAETVAETAAETAAEAVAVTAAVTGTDTSTEADASAPDASAEPQVAADAPADEAAAQAADAAPSEAPSAAAPDEPGVAATDNGTETAAGLEDEPQTQPEGEPEAKVEAKAKADAKTDGETDAETDGETGTDPDDSGAPDTTGGSTPRSIAESAGMAEDDRVTGEADAPGSADAPAEGRPAVDDSAVGSPAEDGPAEDGGVDPGAAEADPADPGMAEPAAAEAASSPADAASQDGPAATDISDAPRMGDAAAPDDAMSGAETAETADPASPADPATDPEVTGPEVTETDPSAAASADTDAEAAAAGVKDAGAEDAGPEDAGLEDASTEDVAPGPGDTAKGEDAAAPEPVESVGAHDIAEEIAPRRAPSRRYKIQEVIKVRQILLVQVVKEERGNKGAALTTYLSLPGRYCVLMPNTARGGGISRKITSAADRKKLREIANELEVPKGAGLIIRTAGSERTKAEIKRDYDYLIRQWDEIRTLTLKSVAPTLIYEEGSLIKRAIRDYYNRSIDEVLVEGEQGYAEARNYMKMLMPSHARNVKRYDEPIPLFSRFQAESYLASMFNPVVQLKSGGYIVIGVTEALVAIDINSGRSTREHSIEETALKTNLEAADEIARQLRLRDLAGLIVIDFIDMEERRNNAAVEKRVKERLKSDRARIQIGRISAFGLLEMSRQRLRPGILETITSPCPHCHGTGLIRSDESLALTILRELEDEGVRRRAREVLAVAPVGVANYLMNQKREALTRFEQRYGIPVRVECDPSLISPEYRIERFKTASRVIPISETTAPITVDSALADEDDAFDEAEILADDEAAEADGVESIGEDARRDTRADARADARGDARADARGDGQNDAQGSGRKRRRRRRRRGGAGPEGRDEAAHADAGRADDDGVKDAIERSAEAGTDDDAAPAAEADGVAERVAEGVANPATDAAPDAQNEKPRRSRSRRKRSDEPAASPQTAPDPLAVMDGAGEASAPREIDDTNPLGPIEQAADSAADAAEVTVPEASPRQAVSKNAAAPTAEDAAPAEDAKPKPKVRRRRSKKTEAAAETATEAVTETAAKTVSDATAEAAGDAGPGSRPASAAETESPATETAATESPATDSTPGTGTEAAEPDPDRGAAQAALPTDGAVTADEAVPDPHANTAATPATDPMTEPAAEAVGAPPSETPSDTTGKTTGKTTAKPTGKPTAKPTGKPTSDAASNPPAADLPTSDLPTSDLPTSDLPADASAELAAPSEPGDAHDAISAE
ncbi:MAG: Rne/Rng family ribonuclease, partial [Pseudomonadota bacterium]